LATPHFDIILVLGDFSAGSPVLLQVWCGFAAFVSSEAALSLSAFLAAFFASPSFAISLAGFGGKPKMHPYNGNYW